LKTEHFSIRREYGALDTAEARQMFLKEKLKIKAELESVRSLNFILGKLTEV